MLGDLEAQEMPSEVRERGGKGGNGQDKGIALEEGRHKGKWHWCGTRRRGACSSQLPSRSTQRVEAPSPSAGSLRQPGPRYPWERTQNRGAPWCSLANRHRVKSHQQKHVLFQAHDHADTDKTRTDMRAFSKKSVFHKSRM